MDIIPIILPDKKMITGYGSGYFIINNNIYYGSLIVFSTKIIPLLNFDFNNIEHTIEKSFDDNLEVVLVGTGKNHLFPSNNYNKNLTKESLNIEFMSTGAACRTYNILLSEDRQVCAILNAI